MQVNVSCSPHGGNMQCVGSRARLVDSQPSFSFCEREKAKEKQPDGCTWGAAPRGQRGASLCLSVLALSVRQLCHPLTVPAFTFCSLSPPSKRDLYHSREAGGATPPALRYTSPNPPKLGEAQIQRAAQGRTNALRVFLSPSIHTHIHILQMTARRGSGRLAARRWTPRNTVPLTRTLWRW